MMRRIKVQWQGREVEGEEVKWEVARGEEWSVYKLSDETTLKVRTFVNKVVRLDERHADGEPVYVVMSQNNVVAHVEPHMMVVRS